jgi:ribose-phosphate pyrophosphokinase
MNLENEPYPSYARHFLQKCRALGTNGGQKELVLLFFTRSTEHLAKNMLLPRGMYKLTTFPDGELHVNIEHHAAHKNVWVIAATNAPAEHIIELLLLVDALQRDQATVSLLLTYAGYARQDRAEVGHALAAQVVARGIDLFAYEQIKIVHVHSKKMHDFLDFEDVIPYELYKPIIEHNDIIVAPDKGAHDLAALLGKKCGKPTIFLEKKRSNGAVTIALSSGDVRGKKVTIIDDMISTGKTVIEASNTLLEHGAQSVDVIATHGLFTAQAVRDLEASPIKNLYVTNTLAQQEHQKIKVLDVGPFLENLIKNS